MAGAACLTTKFVATERFTAQFHILLAGAVYQIMSSVQTVRSTVLFPIQMDGVGFQIMKSEMMGESIVRYLTLKVGADCPTLSFDKK